MPTSNMVLTKQQAYAYLENLEKLKSSFYSLRGNLDEKLNTCLTYEQKNILQQALSESKVNTHDPLSLHTFLTEYLEKLKARPVVTLHLALDPSLPTVQTILNWFSVNLNKEVIVDIILDEELIAGALIESNNRFLDDSLKKQLENGF